MFCPRATTFSLPVLPNPLLRTTGSLIGYYLFCFAGLHESVYGLQNSSYPKDFFGSTFVFVGKNDMASLFFLFRLLYCSNSPGINLFVP